jgi:hypothetical protein
VDHLHIKTLQLPFRRVAAPSKWPAARFGRGLQSTDAPRGWFQLMSLDSVTTFVHDRHDLSGSEAVHQAYCG